MDRHGDDTPLCQLARRAAPYLICLAGEHAVFFTDERPMSLCDDLDTCEDSPCRDEERSRHADLSSALRGFRQRLATFGLGETPDPLLDEVSRTDGPTRDL